MAKDTRWIGGAAIITIKEFITIDKVAALWYDRKVGSVIPNVSELNVFDPHTHCWYHIEVLCQAAPKE
jgi:hypothetical protein